MGCAKKFTKTKKIFFVWDPNSIQAFLILRWVIQSQEDALISITEHQVCRTDGVRSISFGDFTRARAGSRHHRLDLMEPCWGPKVKRRGVLPVKRMHPGEAAEEAEEDVQFGWCHRGS